jgi:tyrosyl-tRNA synthetase
MENVLDILTARGFIEQTTHDESLRDYLESEKVTCYIGFDPTASSLHVGSLVPIMSLAHMQRNGHRPIALVGGGTGLVGDPSGKTEMRKLLTEADVAENVRGSKNNCPGLSIFQMIRPSGQQRGLADQTGIYPFFKRHRPAFFSQPDDQGRKL